MLDTAVPGDGPDICPETPSKGMIVAQHHTLLPPLTHHFHCNRNYIGKMMVVAGDLDDITEMEVTIKQRKMMV